MEPDFEVIGEVSNGPEAIELVHNLRPDVVLMDVNLPGMDGIETTHIICQKYPEIRIIDLSMFEVKKKAVVMREAGAADYVTKSGPSETLIAAIRTCAQALKSSRNPLLKMPARRIRNRRRIPIQTA